MSEEIHDTSHLDSYLKTRRRVSLLNASLKPVLAGAAGAVTIIGAAAFGAWVAGPRFRYAEIDVPRVTLRDVTADHVVPKTIEVEVDHVKPKTVEIDVPRVVTHQVDIDTPHVVPHETVVEVPRIVQHQVDIDVPRVVTPPPPAATDRPRTPDEERFAARPEFQDAPYHGRIVESCGGGALSFEDGQDFFPAHADPATGKTVMDPRNAFDVDHFVGDLGLCRPDQGLWRCTALHHGRETPVACKRGRPA